MNKLLYGLLFVGVFAVLYGVGRTWKLKPETKYNHTLVNGEIAVVRSHEGSSVWLALDQKDCYSINVAMSRKDTTQLKELEDNKTAFPIPAGTFAKVIGGSESRVKVQVVDGPLAGKQGWAEFEYLRPRQPGEFR
jgi:hypothetical protein